MMTFRLKTIKRRLFALLPTKARHYIIRNRLVIPRGVTGSTIYKLADTEHELEKAYRLLHDSYVSQKFITPQASGLRLLPHFVLPTTATLVSKDRDDVVGTLSIIKNCALKLPMEKHFSLEFIKARTPNFAEISALAVKREYRRQQGGAVFLYMLKYMYHYCVSELNINHLCIVIHPKDEDFYAAILFFKRIPGQDVTNYLGAPALAMYLDLDEALVRFEAMYGHKGRSKNLLAFFMESTKELQFIQRPYHLKIFQVVTPEIFESLFLGKGGFFDLISFADYRFLKRAVRGTDLHGYFVEDAGSIDDARSEVRYGVRMVGKIIVDDTIVPIEVFEVGGNGLAFLAPRALHIGPDREVAVMLNIGNQKDSRLQCRLVWSDGSKHGMMIVQSDHSWLVFTKYLYHTKGRNYLYKIR